MAGFRKASINFLILCILSASLSVIYLNRLVTSGSYYDIVIKSVEANYSTSGKESSFNSTTIRLKDIAITHLQQNSSVDQFEEMFDRIRDRAYNYCPPVPSHLLGNLDIKHPSAQFNSFSFSMPADMNNKGIELGGRWTPSQCRARHNVAIVIPYKERLDNLNTFLFNMHPFMQRQELAYQFFVVEQINNQPFNKGIIMNAGFKEIVMLNRLRREFKNFVEFECVIFHDVDLLPTNDLNLYSCPQKPRHLSILVDNFDYLKLYPILVGGVINFPISKFIQVNGYSNEYWGWGKKLIFTRSLSLSSKYLTRLFLLYIFNLGAEDDDLYYRLVKTQIGFERPLKSTKYVMLKHSSRYVNPNRMSLLNQATSRLTNDGLNSVKYTLYGVIKYPLFTHLLIDTIPYDVDTEKRHFMFSTTTTTTSSSILQKFPPFDGTIRINLDQLKLQIERTNQSISNRIKKMNMTNFQTNLKSMLKKSNYILIK